MSDVFVGVDISKQFLDVAVRPSGDTFRIDLGRTSIDEAADQVHQLAPAVVVVEASGGLERGVLAAFCRRQIPVSLVNPRQVRDFARAIGRLAKTDRIDSLTLAHFAEAVRPVAYQLPSPARQELGALISRRRQLVRMRAEEKTRLTLEHGTADIQAGVRTHVKWLSAQIRKLERAIEQTVISDGDLRDRVHCLRTVPGVGAVTAATLVTALPELGTLDRRKLAALAGVAPLNCDSGERRGPRRCWGGRADVRVALYMATLAGIRHSPLMRAKYARLRQRGKPGLVAIVACMRQLLTVLNAIARAGSAFEPGHGTATAA